MDVCHDADVRYPVRAIELCRDLELSTVAFAGDPAHLYATHTRHPASDVVAH